MISSPARPKSIDPNLLCTCSKFASFINDYLLLQIDALFHDFCNFSIRKTQELAELASLCNMSGQ